VAEELRAHGYREPAARFWERSLLSAADRPAGDGDPTGTRLQRATSLYALGRVTEAILTVDSLLAGPSAAPADALGLRGVLAARQGDRPRAQEINTRLAALPRTYSFGVPTVWRARIAAALGDRDAAVTLLRTAFAEGREYDLWLHRDQDLASLGGYPPFEELTRAKQ
jgi:tetratricopeptide (TPR) repeat protein